MDYAELWKLAKRIEYLESREVVSGADSWLKLEDRLTALEANAPEKPCLRCSGEGKLVGEYGWMVHADGTCPICEGAGKQSPDTSKVDEPEKWIVCWDCTYDPVCTLADRLRLGCSKGLRKQKQPPPTCGNCTEGWTRTESLESVLCDYDTYEYPKDKPACPHHDRRDCFNSGRPDEREPWMPISL